MSPDSLTALLDEARQRVDAALGSILPDDDSALARAMRYAALGEGKRVRPALVYAVADAIGLERRVVDTPAAAVEMIHAFSLVHDDLPALDDDDLRRGLPTLHAEFGEATAILAGDALLNLAFAALAAEGEGISAAQRCQAVAATARAVGVSGMIGGQMLDLQASAGTHWRSDDLEVVHRRKTGSLMRLCGELPAIYAGTDRGLTTDVARCCEDLGLMFQIRDDLLDVAQESGVLGKTAGKDEAQNKLTYPALLGAEEARRRLSVLGAKVRDSIDRLPGETLTLRALAAFVAERQS